MARRNRNAGQKHATNVIASGFVRPTLMSLQVETRRSQSSRRPQRSQLSSCSRSIQFAWGCIQQDLSVRMYEPTDRRNPTHPIRLDGAVLGFLGSELFFTPCILSFCCHMKGMTKGSSQQQKAAQKPKLARRQPRPFGYTNPTKDQLYAMLTDAWKNTQELSKRRKVGAVK